MGFTGYRFEVIEVATDRSAVRSPVVTSKRTSIPRRVATITNASSVNCSILPFKERVSLGISKTQTGGHTRLGHTASLHRLFNLDHEFRAQSKVLRFGLPEAEISEYIAAATQLLGSVRHHYGFSRNFAIISLQNHCSKPAASDWGDANSPAGATDDANITLDFVVDRIGESPGEHSVESPDLDVDTRGQSQTIDIGKERIEEIGAEVFGVLGVKQPAQIEVIKCGRKYPQPHRLLSELTLRVSPVHRMLCARLEALLSILQRLFVPRR
jgi:hypothetical protein